jgi:putrescine aminotransferase
MLAPFLSVDGAGAVLASGGADVAEYVGRERHCSFASRSRQPAYICFKRALRLRNTDRMTPTETQSNQTFLWHPFADMSAVKTSEFIVDRADDVWLWDADGKRYLDATASLWYANVGHGRREIAEAVARQLSQLEAYSVFGDFANRPALELAERLAHLAPMRGARVFFGSGGGDGIEAAAKLARRYWSALGHPERNQILSRISGYHGTHGLGTSIAGIEANRTGLGAMDRETTRVERDSAEDLEQTIERLGAGNVAAFFVEPVIGAGGVYPPVPGYMEAVAAVCKRTGVLLVIDAVICGFGRIGNWFAAERWGIEPDMIVFAKGVTSGYLPLGGVVISEQLTEPFWASPGSPVFRQGATYSGHPTCCAAALANLDVLEREHLPERALALESVLYDALAALADDPLVADVRGGVGLLAAVELSPELLAQRPGAVTEAFKAAREHGVLIRPLATGLAVSPPLTVTEEHIGLIAEAFGVALDALRAPARTAASIA